jgi:hypothetical protein
MAAVAPASREKAMAAVQAIFERQVRYTSFPLVNE